MLYFGNALSIRTMLMNSMISYDQTFSASLLMCFSADIKNRFSNVLWFYGMPKISTWNISQSHSHISTKFHSRQREMPCSSWSTPTRWRMMGYKNMRSAGRIPHEGHCTPGLQGLSKPKANPSQCWRPAPVLCVHLCPTSRQWRLILF